MYIGVHVEHHYVLLLDFNEAQIFSTDLKKINARITNLMSMGPVEEVE
jgi:hypothetical protein